jgi:hypothetical protein
MSQEIGFLDRFREVESWLCRKLESDGFHASVRRSRLSLEIEVFVVCPKTGAKDTYTIDEWLFEADDVFGLVERMTCIVRAAKKMRCLACSCLPGDPPCEVCGSRDD